MRKRDCIEFLWDRLKPFLPKNYTIDESIELLSILEQAKLIHNQEHYVTWCHSISENEPITFKNYYKETFGGQQ